MGFYEGGESGGRESEQGPPGIVPRGAWLGDTSYAANDTVLFGGSQWEALKASNGVQPGTDATTWRIFVSKGDPGPAGSGSAGVMTPQTLGLKAWTLDPVSHRGDNGRAFPGQVWGTRLSLGDGVVTAVNYRVWVAGVNMIAGQNFIGLISIATGQTVAVTADQTANFSGGGAKRALFTTSPDLPAGDYYIGFLFNTTGAGANPNNIPSLATANNGDTDLLNFRGPGQVARSCKIGGGFDLTAFPASFDFAGNNQNNRTFFVALD